MTDNFWRKADRIFGLLPLAAIFAILVVSANIEIKDLDLWLHLAMGRFITLHRFVPSVDVLSCSIAGSPWVNHEWLFQIIVYNIYPVIWRVTMILAVALPTTILVILIFTHKFRRIIMSQIGRLNTLQVLREVEFGVYLDGEELGDILLPKREVPQGTKVDDMLEVFIYFDSKDIIIASTKKPKAQVGEFASLRVVDTNKIGAFLDWGLPKDVLVPFREQSHTLKKNHKVSFQFLMQKYLKKELLHFVLF